MLRFLWGLFRAGLNYYHRVGYRWLVFNHIVTLIGAAGVYRYSKRNTLTKTQAIAMVLQIFHIITVLTSTVLSRKADMTYRIIWDPFWGEKEILAGSTWRWLGIFANVVLLSPMGVLLPVISKRFRMWNTMLAGFLFSFFIEMLQLSLKRGYFEPNDILHNVLGVFLAYLFYICCCKIWKDCIPFCLNRGKQI